MNDYFWGHVFGARVFEDFKGSGCVVEWLRFLEGGALSRLSKKSSGVTLP